MGKTEIETFLSHLASTRKVAAATQRQDLNAKTWILHDGFLKKELIQVCLDIINTSRKINRK